MPLRRCLIACVCALWGAMAQAGEPPCTYAQTFERGLRDDPGFIVEHEPGIRRLWTLRRVPSLAGLKVLHLRAETWADAAGWSLLKFPDDAPLLQQLGDVEVVQAGSEKACPIEWRKRVRYEVRRVDQRDCPAGLAAATRLGEAVLAETRSRLLPAHWLGRPGLVDRGMDRIMLDGNSYQLRFEGGGFSLGYGTDDQALMDASDDLLDAVVACASKARPIVREIPII